MTAVAHVKMLLMVNVQAVVFEVWCPFGIISLGLNATVLVIVYSEILWVARKSICVILVSAVVQVMRSTMSCQKYDWLECEYLELELRK